MVAIILLAMGTLLLPVVVQTVGIYTAETIYENHGSKYENTATVIRVLTPFAAASTFIIFAVWLIYSIVIAATGGN